jgi:signal transduction histidine kinase
MEDPAALWRHRLLTRLTTIKLAVQLLDRKASLSQSERQLINTVLEASDHLAADILNGGESDEKTRQRKESGFTDSGAIRFS